MEAAIDGTGVRQLCEELQAKVDQVGDYRRLLEQMKPTAQELSSDQEAQWKRPKTCRTNWQVLRNPSSSRVD